jgi:deoxycytidine triphosphate deaminase
VDVPTPTPAELAALTRIDDPLPNIKPALLNWRDIVRYVEATGMIDPFHNSPEYLKPASYRVPLLGEYLYWDGDDKPHRDELAWGQKLVIQPNSITFLSVEPTFRLPLYIAARFNLKVRNVYRGLLLGTGPMIDPGFQGRLYIPLHNLTTNDYAFEGGEVLIWVEFTKLSDLPTMHLDSDGLIREVINDGESERLDDPFRLPESNRSLLQYVHEAAGARSVRSSVPDIVSTYQRRATELEDAVKASEKSVERAGQQVKDAETAVQNANNRLTWVAVIGGLAALAAVFALFFQLQSSILSLDTRIDQLSPTHPSVTAVPSPAGPSPSPSARPT